MIIDVHTHIFPPEVRARRDDYIRKDRTFAEIYSNPKAKIAGAEELLRSMESAEVDVSVALGFAWRDPDDCRRHNDYLLESAAKSGGRILAFCNVNASFSQEALGEVERCVRGGARGIGELRPQSQDYHLEGEPAELLATVARQHQLLLLFHVTEPVGRDYAGKEGLPMSEFLRFAQANPDLRIIGAHLAGGLPLLAFKKEIGPVVKALSFDTAAVPFSYEPDVYEQVAAMAGDKGLLFGSDFPLITQHRQMVAIRESGLTAAQQEAVMGENARRLVFS